MRSRQSPSPSRHGPRLTCSEHKVASHPGANRSQANGSALLQLIIRQSTRTPKVNSRARRPGEPRLSSDANQECKLVLATQPPNKLAPCVLAPAYLDGPIACGHERSLPFGELRHTNGPNRFMDAIRARSQRAPRREAARLLQQSICFRTANCRSQSRLQCRARFINIIHNLSSSAPRSLTQLAPAIISVIGHIIAPNRARRRRHRRDFYLLIRVQRAKWALIFS